MPQYVYGAFCFDAPHRPTAPPKGVLLIRINNYDGLNYDHVIFGWPVEVQVTLGEGTVVRENEGRHISLFPDFTMPEKTDVFRHAYGVTPRLYAYVDGGPDLGEDVSASSEG